MAKLSAFMTELAGKGSRRALPCLDEFGTPVAYTNANLFYFLDHFAHARHVRCYWIWLLYMDIFIF